MNSRRFVSRGARVLLLALVALLAVAGSTFAAPSGAGTVIRWMIKSNSASANYVGYGSDGCSYSSVTLFASDSMSVSGTSTSTGGVYFEVYGYNWCTGASWGGYANESVPSGSLSVISNKSATLSPTVLSFFDYSTGSTYPIRVSATWTATGAATRQRFNNQSIGPNGHMQFSGTGSEMPASVAASAISPSGDMLAGNWDLVGAAIDSAQQSQLYVMHR